MPAAGMQSYLKMTVLNGLLFTLIFMNKLPLRMTFKEKRKTPGLSGGFDMMFLTVLIFS